MKKTLLVLALCTVVISLASACIAREAPPAPGPIPSQPHPLGLPSPCILSSLRILQPNVIVTMAEFLKLNDQEKTKVQELLTKANAAAAPLLETLKKADSDYVNLLTDPNSTQADLTAAADKAMKAEQAVMDEKIKTLYTLRAALTPEQNKQLSEVLSRFTAIWKPGPAPQHPAENKAK